MDADNKPIIWPNLKEYCTVHCFKVSGTYTWTIHNFGFAFDNECDCEYPFASPMFSFGNNEELDWEIQLFPSTDKVNNYVSLKVVYYNTNDYEEVQAECQVSILGKNIMHTVKTNSLYNFTDMAWEKEDFIKMNYLMNEKNGLLIKNKLTLFCQIDATGYCESKEDNGIEWQIYLNRLKVFEDLQLLMNNNSYDIILVLNNEKYYVHKYILASRSPVFSAMFEHCMQEQMNGEVVLTDISSETLNKLIQFIYIGVININEISKETLAELLIAADKYELNDLKEICEMVFYNTLNISNAIDILIFADFHNAEKLKYATAHFMIANIKEFNNTSQFESFSKSHSHILPKFIEVSEGSAFNSIDKSQDSDSDDYNSFVMESAIVKKNSWSVTQMLVDKETYTWKINNFSYFLEKEVSDEPIVSLRFGKHKQYKWQLFLFPRGVNNEAKDYVSLHIKFLSEDKKINEMKARYKFFIIDNKGQKRNNFKSDILIFIAYGERLGEDRFLEKEYLMENKDKLLPNNTLTIICKISSRVSTRCDASYLNEMNLSIPKYRFGISTKQIKLFESGIFSDLTLVAANKKFPVHQNILSVRSPVFFNMLSEQLANEKTVIEISDVNPAVLEDFLLFVYSGNVKHLDATAKDLYVEARKYNIENLKDICETYLCINLTLENVCDNFTFAQVNMAFKLKSNSSEYIINNIKNVCATPGYNNLVNTRPQLLKDIIYKLSC